MITKTITLYDYAELTPEAQARAYSTWQASDKFDSYELQVYLDNLLEDLLEEHKIVCVADARKEHESDDANIFFSLTHSQGDGVMFEGTFLWKDYHVNIRQVGMYSHSYAKDMEITNEQGEPIGGKVAEKFEKIYQSICKELEARGYEHIEDVQSEPFFHEDCNANERLFYASGRSYIEE